MSDLGSGRSLLDSVGPDMAAQGVGNNAPRGHVCDSGDRSEEPEDINLVIARLQAMMVEDESPVAERTDTGSKPLPSGVVSQEEPAAPASGTVWAVSGPMPMPSLRGTLSGPYPSMREDAAEDAAEDTAEDTAEDIADDIAEEPDAAGPREPVNTLPDAPTAAGAEATPDVEVDAAPDRGPEGHASTEADASSTPEAGRGTNTLLPASVIPVPDNALVFGPELAITARPAVMPGAGAGSPPDTEASAPVIGSSASPGLLDLPQAIPSMGRLGLDTPQPAAASAVVLTPSAAMEAVARAESPAPPALPDAVPKADKPDPAADAPPESASPAPLASGTDAVRVAPPAAVTESVMEPAMFPDHFDFA